MASVRIKALLVLVVAILILSLFVTVTYRPRDTGHQKVPVLAHYYIWWRDTTWSSGRYEDFPLIGNYSSTDRAVVRQHILWAKSAGLSGWIVSWKGDLQRNAALSVLAVEARTEDFGFVIWYESVDSNGSRRPISTVDVDFSYLITEYAGEPSYRIFRNKFAIILGKSDQYSDQELHDLATKYRPRILVLGSETDPNSYEKRSSYLDGNYYYWSSVDPYTNERYPEKLKSMSDSVHKYGGIWIAPVAPGYDSRRLGGETVVPRKNGKTLSVEFSLAIDSRPDAIGIISWNEFGENTYIEPSVKFGNFYLTVLSSLISRELK